MSPFARTRRGLSALALILALAVPALAARADISTSANDTSLAASLGNANVLDAFSELTPEQQTAILTRYTTLQTEITATKTQASAMRIALDSGANTDPANTEAAYQLLLQKVADKTADRDALAAWIAQKPAPVIQDSYDNSNNSGSSGSGQQSPLSGIVNSLAQQMMGGSGGMGGLGGLSNLANLNSGNLGNLGYGGAAQTAASGQKPAGPASTDKDAPKKDEKPKADPCEPAPKSGSQTADNPGKAADDKVSTGSQTADNAGKAKDDIVASGSQTADNPGKAKDDQVATSPSKPACKGSDYTTPDPNATDAAKMKAEMDAIVASGQFQCNPSQSSCSYTDKNGVFHVANGRQCAALTQAWAAAHGAPVGSASGWTGGKNVLEGGVQPGTPIATANYDGKYCDTSNGGCGVPGGHITHTGIFYGYIDDNNPSAGFKMLYQWSGQNGRGAPQITTYTPGPRKDDAQYYFTINSNTSLNKYIPILQPVWIALKLVPFDGGLLNV